MDEYWLSKEDGEKQHYLYFFQEESQEKEFNVQKITIDSEQQEREHPSSSSKKIRQEEPPLQNQKQPQTVSMFKKEKRREIMGIETSSGERVKYIHSKKGVKEETNDLTINTAKIIRNTLPQFKHFFSPNEEELSLIGVFQQQKPNLLAIRSLFGVEEGGSVAQENRDGKIRRKLTKKGDRIRKFVMAKFEDEKVLKEILKSKKMSFINKIRIIKYLETTRKGCIDPANFSCWKNCQL